MAKVKTKLKAKVAVKVIAKDKIFRILDANLNRATEGVRVAEDIVRFVMNDDVLTKRLKEIRHELVDLMKDKSWELRGARRVKSDVGANKTILAESKRKNLADVFTANIKRAEEAVRVFEELSKLFDPIMGPKFKKLRFELYDIEQRAGYRLKSKKN